MNFTKSTYDTGIFPANVMKRILLLLTFLSVPLIYLLVYYTGGIKYVFSHSMYFIIILNSLIFGLKGGFLTGIIGGIALGPLMPIDIITGEKQALLNWVYRLLFFTGVGCVNGFIVDKLKSKLNDIIKLSTHNQETGLPNLFSIYKKINKADENQKTEKKVYLAISFLNINEISTLLGRGALVMIIKEAFNRLKKRCQENSEIIQVSSDKLLIVVEGDDYEYFCNQITYLLRKPFIFNNIPSICRTCYWNSHSTG